MAEPSSSSVGAVILYKLFGWKLIAMVGAVMLAFFINWPKTAKEGVTRIGVTVMCSAMFGDMLANTVSHFAPFLLSDGEAGRMPIYALAGAPGWWVMGWVRNWLDKTQGKDIAEVLAELKKINKEQ
jgi:hypothetical protein